MNDEQLLNLTNVLNSEDGFELVKVLLDKLGAFERGINVNASDKEILITQSRRQLGLWLLDNCYCANPNKYMEILKERFIYDRN